MTNTQNSWSQHLNRSFQGMNVQSYEIGQQLRQHNKYEDLLDVFIIFIIKRAPTIFILINMTLMIWLVQTIYSSRSDKVPRSIYFYSPYFQAKPFLNIYTTKHTCQQGFQTAKIKTFPSIQQLNIKRTNLTKWGSNQQQFCIQKISRSSNFSLECLQPRIYCSGYCVDNEKQCPITSIKKIRDKDDIPKGYQIITMELNQSYKYVFSRESKNDFVVGISVLFQNRCANDFKYFDRYDNFSQYWNQTSNCGGQGRVPAEIFNPFDQQSAYNFLDTNNIWSQTIQTTTTDKQSTIGTISLIKFSNKTLECSLVQSMSKQLKNYLVEDAVKPTFTQSMLIIAFVFFTISWAWLLAYYCFDGNKKQKNMIVILMCIIQLIVICFLYVNNLGMFKTEELIGRIADCIDTQIPSTTNWASWRTNSSPFLSIMYSCTCFLLLQIICHFIDRKIYVPYYVEQPVIATHPSTQIGQQRQQNLEQRKFRCCCPCC